MFDCVSAPHYFQSGLALKPKEVKKALHLIGEKVSSAMLFAYWNCVDWETWQMPASLNEQFQRKHPLRKAFVADFRGELDPFYRVQVDLNTFRSSRTK